MTFVNLYGEFELAKMLMEGKTSFIEIADTEIGPLQHSKHFTEKNSDISKRINTNLVVTYKYGDGYSFLEFVLDDQGLVKTIIYQRNLH